MTLRIAVQKILAIPAGILILLARIYQGTLSPYLGRQCRFVPTCSNYFIEAITKHGAIKGTFLGIRRILQCHPFSRKSGYDPVP
jgi:putative membrane protein insertion efficiency factor